MSGLKCLREPFYFRSKYEFLPNGTPQYDSTPELVDYHYLFPSLDSFLIECAKTPGPQKYKASLMDIQLVEILIRQHLESNCLLSSKQATCWKIDCSQISGRGLIAIRDIECDELVYADAPMLLGPRCYNKYLPMCVHCYRSGCALFPCDHGCGLPVCSDACQNDARHLDVECAYLRRLKPICERSAWSVELLQAVVPIRALLLPPDVQRIFYSLQCNETDKHAREVEMLKKNVKEKVKTDEDELMRRVCRAMDTNSFETVVVQDGSSTSLRALFPVGALTNHQCVPNTRHFVDEKGHLLVYAAIPISKGQEITMSYTDLLWDSLMRRQFLRATKHFECQCSRCSDPTEIASYLGALKCALEKCHGKVLPLQPLSFNTCWVCDQCGLIIKSNQISSIRAGIIAATEEVLHKNPRKILKFIERELSILVPQTNYIMMDMMFTIISFFGRVPDLYWQDLTNDELDIKIDYCNKLLETLTKLKCGDCTKGGLILYELYCTNKEKIERLSSSGGEHELNSTINEHTLQRAIKILKNDVLTPRDYRKKYSESLSTSCET